MADTVRDGPRCSRSKLYIYIYIERERETISLKQVEVYLLHVYIDMYAVADRSKLKSEYQTEQRVCLNLE